MDYYQEKCCFCTALVLIMRGRFNLILPKSVKCLTILEEKSHKSLGVSLFLLQLFFHPLYCHLEEEADEVLVSCFRTNHAEG